MDHEAEIARLNGVVADRDKMLAKAIAERNEIVRRVREWNRVSFGVRWPSLEAILDELAAQPVEVPPTSETDPW